MTALPATRRQPNAAQVSRALAAAGLVKAAPYSPWGRDHEGFIVGYHDSRAHRGAPSVRTIHVLYSKGSRPSEEATAHQELTHYAEALEAAGYRVARETNKAGRVRSLTLLRWED
jgi:hypothetical protein